MFDQSIRAVVMLSGLLLVVGEASAQAGPAIAERVDDLSTQMAAEPLARPTQPTSTLKEYAWREPTSDGSIWRRQWDFAVVGFSAGGFGLNLQLVTRTWRWFRWTLLDIGFEGGLETEGPSTFDLHVGTLFGFGGHSGEDLRSSHWLVVGLWYGQKLGLGFLLSGVKGSFKGLFLPFGYEFRRRFGKTGNKVWGVRLIAAYSPAGRGTTWSTWSKECSGGLFCMDWDGAGNCGCDTSESGPLNKKLERWMFTFSIFVGG